MNAVVDTWLTGNVCLFRMCCSLSLACESYWKSDLLQWNGKEEIIDSFLPLRYPFLLLFIQLCLNLSRFYMKWGTQAATMVTFPDHEGAI